MLHEFDTSKFYLGVLCKKGHDWEGTGQSLRYQSSRGCSICRSLQEKRIVTEEERQQRREYKRQIRELEKQLSIDTDKFYLGDICSCGHAFEDTGLSLRYTASHKCTECHKIKSRRRQKQTTEPSRNRRAALKQKLRELEQERGIDTSKYRLGTLCKRGHNWNDTGFSLRTIRPDGCLECARENKRRFRQENPDLIKEWDRQFRERHPGYGRKFFNPEKNRIRCRDRYYAKREECNSKNRENYYRNWEARRQQARIYRQTPQGRLVKQRSQARRRALKRSTRLVPYRTSDLKQLFEKFDHACTYCGKPNANSLDHFIPIDKGGPDCLGNIVPSCISCNCSKSTKDALEWYQKQEFFDRKRWKKILEILGKDDPNQLPLF